MPTSLAHHATDAPHRGLVSASALVACPDSRPPAYQAAVGLARAGRLDRLATGFYSRGTGAMGALLKRLAPEFAANLERKLARRRDPEIPPDHVHSHSAFDLALALENRVGGALRGRIARDRTVRFDRWLAGLVRREHPDVLLAFSDVASDITLPLCRSIGIPTILSMVHGDVREEVEVLEREAERSPEFFRIYLGDGPIDRRALAWLHARRLRDLDGADRILVPSEHIAGVLARHGTDPGRIDVIPYAADTRSFRPRADRSHGETCRFLFAGGITQRKGIKDLLDAWRLVRRPGWSLALLGAMPRDPSPLEPYRDDFTWLGRVGHAEMARHMAEADVFVFPSLFEGSAVVTYEALACGLPSIVTAESGAMARDGLDGFLVPAADPVALAARMETLGRDPSLRAFMARNAREQAERHDWPRYHESLLGALDRAASGREGGRHG